MWRRPLPPFPLTQEGGLRQLLESSHTHRPPPMRAEHRAHGPRAANGASEMSGETVKLENSADKPDAWALSGLLPPASGHLHRPFPLPRSSPGSLEG